MTTSSPARETAGVYGEIVEGYIREHRARLRGQLAYFGSLQVAQAISQAARGEYPTGQRHPHQYRVRLDALLESERRLRTCESELVSVESFDKLINLIGSIIQSIPGIGELAVYDVSIRIGAHLGSSRRRCICIAGHVSERPPSDSIRGALLCRRVNYHLTLKSSLPLRSKICCASIRRSSGSRHVVSEHAWVSRTFARPQLPSHPPRGRDAIGWSPRQ